MRTEIDYGSETHTEQQGHRWNIWNLGLIGGEHGSRQHNILIFK